MGGNRGLVLVTPAPINTMKIKGDFVGSHWASQGSYGKPLSNKPGSGARAMGGSKGSYAPQEKKSGSIEGNPNSKTGPPVRNSPGKGSGHQSSTPVKRAVSHMGGMHMGED